MIPRALTTALLLAVLAGIAAAQTNPSDPRSVEDPRTVGKDPRSVRDPREPEKQRLEPDHPQFAELAEGAELFDGLYASGNEGALNSAMRAASWELTGYIAGESERYVDHVEHGGLKNEEGRLAAKAFETKLRAIARVADTVAGDTRFRFYVERVLSWTPDEQARYRQSQELLKAGRIKHEAAQSPQEALGALTPLRQALEISRQLGDVPGQAVAVRRVAAIQLDNRQYDDARATFQDAIRVGREVRDLDTVWEGLMGLFRCAVNRKDIDTARSALQDQYDLALEMEDEETQRQVLTRLVMLEDFARRNMLPFDRGGAEPIGAQPFGTNDRTRGDRPLTPEPFGSGDRGGDADGNRPGGGRP